MRLPGAYLSRLSGRNIAGTAAKFPVFVTIAFKLLSAVLARKMVISFSADICLMAVPPVHTAGIGAELLLPAALRLYQRSAAVFAGFGTGDVGVAVDMGPDRSCRESQFRGNHGRTVSLQPHIVNGDFILQSHSDTPSVMTAK